MIGIEDKSRRPDAEGMVPYVGIPLFRALCAALERNAPCGEHEDALCIFRVRRESVR